ncbi:phage tail tape measure protein [Eubacteriales bacterium OttesenSCG-928-N13]|nr:phage tail tape measure protein [Eubacteriales bacterium OttesenSCG-928-N13]
MADGTVKIGVDLDESGLKSKLSGLGRSINGVLGGVAKAMTVASAGITGLGAAAVAVGSDFEKEMSNIAAITGMNADEMKQFSDGVRASALKTGTPLMDIASNAKMVAEAGGDMNLMMEQMTHGANLAMASQSNMETSLDFLGSAMKAFGVETEGTQSAVDSFAYLTTMANLELSHIAESYVNVGGSAAQAGMSIDNVNAILNTFSNAGLKGGAAGTTLNTMLNNLRAPTDKARKELKRLNVELFDAEGNSRDVFETMSELEKTLGGLTDEERAASEAIIFDTVAQKGWNMIVNDGVESILELSEELEGASNAYDGMGQAAGMARRQMDNLSGDTSKLKGSVTNLGVAVSEKLSPTLRSIAQYATNVVDTVTTSFEENGFEGLAAVVGQEVSKAAVIIAGKASDMVDAGSKLLGGLLDGISDNSDSLASSAVSIVEALVKGIGDNGAKVIGAFSQLIVDLAPKIPELVSDIVDAGLQIGEALAQGLMDAIPAVAGAAGDIIKEADGITFAIGMIALAIGAFNLGGDITAKFDAIATGVGSIGKALAANPLGVTLAAIAIAIAGIVKLKSLIDDANDPVKQLQKETENLNTSTEDVTGSLADLQEGMGKNTNMRTAISRYRELQDIISDTGTTTEQVADATAELNGVRQWIIDNSNGVVTAEGAITGALDAQLEALDGMTAAQQKAYSAELLSKYAEAQAQLPQSYARNNELLAQQNEMLESMGDEYTMLAGLQMKLTEAVSLVDQEELMQTEEGMQRLNEILREASDLTGGTYDFQHLTGLSATVDELKGKTDGFSEGMQAIDDTITANADNIKAWESVVEASFNTGIITIEQAASTLGVSVQVFAERMGLAYDAATGTINEKATEIADAVSEAADATSNASDTVIDSNEGAAKSYGDLSAEAKNAADVQEEAAAREKEALAFAKSAFEANLGVAGNMFSKLTKDTKQGAKDLIKNLNDNTKDVEAWNDNLAKLAEMGVSQGIIDELKKQGPKAGDTAKQLVKDLEKGGTDKLDELNTAWANSVQAALDATKSEIEGTEFQSSADAMLDELATAMTTSTKLTSGITTAMSTAATGATVPTAELTGKGKEMDEQVAQGASESASVITDALNTAGSLAATSTDISGFRLIGMRMCAGVAAGIRAGESAITAAIKLVAAAAKAAFDSAMQINSPAKVMIPGGMSVSEGIAVGIDKGSQTVENKIALLSKRIEMAGSHLEPLVLESMYAAQNRISYTPQTASIAAQSTAHNKQAEDYALLAKLLGKEISGLSMALDMDGQRVAELNAGNNSRAINDMSRNYVLGMGG